MSNDPTVLIFGGTGAIGRAIARRFERAQWRVVGTSRTGSDGNAKPVSGEVVRLDPFDAKPGIESLDRIAPFEAVCWAQGVNINDSAAEFDESRHLDVYRANCLFVLKTLNWLLTRKLLAERARLCVISSIWQQLARQNKLSYCVSKAALQGLVLSAAVDLAPRGILVNAVLPGAIDTPMTRRALSAEQIRRLEQASPFGRLATLEEVAEAVYSLCSRDNKGVSGQFIVVDSGFSYARLV